MGTFRQVDKIYRSEFVKKSVRQSVRHTSLVAMMLGAAAGGGGHVLAQALPSTQNEATKITQDQTSGTTDQLYQKPFIDVDEWRDRPVRHHYIHGGFSGTEARFSFYFPDASSYHGRFFQYITPFPVSENLSQSEPAGDHNAIGFTLSSGGYFVETNGGGPFDLGRGKLAGGDPSISAYRANAAAAQYSRVVAQRLLGGGRPFGYAYGGSGGAYRTIGAIENTTGVWDGVVPFVAGSSVAIPNVFTVRMYAMQLLHDKIPQIVDAMEPGGSGDPYAGLNAEEAGALQEVTRMGYPLQSWFGWKTMGIHGFLALYGGMVMADPGYFKDFWTKPGYLGYQPPAWLAKARVQFSTTIAAPLTENAAVDLGLMKAEQSGGVDSAFKAGALPVGFRLADLPPQVYFLGGDLIVKSGAAAGKRIMLVALKGKDIVSGVANPDILAQIKPGDQVEIDNSNFLASFTYHRHQVPGPEYKVWDQFRDASGKPIYPQRPMLLGPLFVGATAGSLPSGKYQGKMIMLESLWDREAFPWQADWYRQKVKDNWGSAADDHFRVWMTEHALHGDEAGLEDPSRTISYIGDLQQALRDLSAWAERGVSPPASTSYEIKGGQVIVPDKASERKGIQPVVTLVADGKVRAVTTPGTRINFKAIAEVPPGAGVIVGADWDPEGTGKYPIKAKMLKQGGKVTFTYSYRYSRLGSYFPGILVRSQREGNAASIYAQPTNLARARVVVR